MPISDCLGRPACSWCLRDEAQVARLFMGPGVWGEPGTTYICNRCVANCHNELEAAGVPHTPNVYCVVCGFEIRSEASTKVLRGRVCSGCLYEIGLHCLGIGRLPFIGKVPFPLGEPRWKFRIRFALNSTKRNRLAFWALILCWSVLLATLAVTLSAPS